MGSAPVLFGAREAATVLAARLHGAVDAEISAVAVDSRAVTAGVLFVALPGERTDGHRFVADALAAGAAAVLVSNQGAGGLMPPIETLAADYPRAAILTVSDTLTALQMLAGEHRSRMAELSVIGITGSNGKTTTKELVGAVVSRHAPTFVSRGNLNSDIGLPLSVFDITPQHRYAVLEMGMNRVGEMRQLAAIARPDIALITNIGTAHIGNIGSISKIINEKRSICAEFNGSQRLLIREDESHFAELAEGVDGEVLPYGPRSTDGWQGHRSCGLEGSTLLWRGHSIRLALPGEHSVRNALAAIHVGVILEVEEHAIVDAIESVRPLFGRGQIVNGAVTAIVDCYNANPESVRQALDFAVSLKTHGKRIAVLGAMKELGEHAPDAHRFILESALQSDFDAVLLLGQEFAPAALASDDERLTYCSSFEELVQALCAVTTSGDLVLIKGSRSFELERLVPYITTKED